MAEDNQKNETQSPTKEETGTTSAVAPASEDKKEHDEVPPKKDKNKTDENTAENGTKDEEEVDLIKLGGLDLNSYATKKSLAQGILDLALLAANASQLKFILSAGPTHEFYDLILWLVVSSIVLQVVQAVILIVLALIFDINKMDEQKAANIINNVCLAVVVLIVVINVVICGFDIKSQENIRASTKLLT